MAKMVEATAAAAPEAQAQWRLDAHGLLEANPADPNWPLLQQYRRMVEAIMPIPGCIGPLHQLWGVERLDTNRALQALLLHGPIPIVARDIEASKQIFKTIEQFPDFSAMVEILSIDAVDSHSFHHLHDSSHSQLPLIFSATDHKFDGLLGMTPRSAAAQNDGFVGYAANLFVMPSPEMRQTVGHLMLQDTMVFDTNSSLAAFRGRCYDAGVCFQKLLSLEGLAHNVVGPGWSNRGFIDMSAGVLLFSQVPPGLMDASPLDMRLRVPKVTSLF